MLRLALLLGGLSSALGCGESETPDGFFADVTVDGETSPFSSGCTLAPIQDVSGSDGHGFEASDLDSDAGIYGVSLRWSAAEVTGPGQYEFDPFSVAAFVLRPDQDGSGQIGRAHV